MTNKEIVLKFYEEIFNNWDLSNLDSFMRDDYKQHSIEVKDGKAGFIEFFNGFLAMKPHATVISALEDGDQVCIFFKCAFENGVVAKVFDLYRLEDGKLAEHWDCTARVDNIEQAAGNSHF